MEWTKQVCFVSSKYPYWPEQGRCYSFGSLKLKSSRRGFIACTLVCKKVSGELLCSLNPIGRHVLSNFSQSWSAWQNIQPNLDRLLIVCRGFLKPTYVHRLCSLSRLDALMRKRKLLEIVHILVILNIKITSVLACMKKSLAAFSPILERRVVLS